MGKVCRNWIAILFLATIGASFCQVEDRSILNQRTGMPEKGYISSNTWFYNFQGVNSQTFRGNISLFSKFESSNDWNGTVILLPWNNTINRTQLAEDCGESFDLGDSIGYLRMRPVDSNDQFSCFRVPTTSNGKKSWTFEYRITDTYNQGAWFVTSRRPIEAPKASAESANTFTPELNLVCVETQATESTVTVSILSAPNSKVVFEISSPHFCAFSSGKILGLLKRIKAIPAFFLVLALVVLFWGKKLIKWILCCAGCLTGSIIAALVMVFVTLGKLISSPETINSKYLILTIFIIIVSGAILGYLFTKITRFVFIIEGGLIGFSGSIKVYELIVVMTGYSSENLEMGVVIFSVCLGVLVGYLVHDHLLIMSTAVGGAFLTTVCVGALTNSYPDMENYRHYNMIDPSIKKRLISFFLLYSLLWILLTVAGAYVQYSAIADPKTSDKEETADNPEVSFDEYRTA